MRVKYLPEADIEFAANDLLKSFESKYGKIDGYKIPVEDIAERYMGYSFEMDDLDAQLGSEEVEVHGCINFDSKLITINSKLDPTENPQFIGRFKSTLGHEVGHDILHKTQIIQARSQFELFAGAPANDMLCKKSDSKESIEWQADRLSWYLLLPKYKMFDLWYELTGSFKPLPMSILTKKFRSDTKIWLSEQDRAEITLKDLARNKLEVSAKSFLLRLQNLGLIIDRVETELI